MLSKDDVLKNFLKEDTEDVIKIYECMSLAYNKGMTYFDCRYLGLKTEWNDETRTLSIEQTPINCAYRDYKWEWKNSKNN